MPNSYHDDVSFNFQDGHKRYRWLLATPAERILAGAIDILCTVVAAMPLLWLVYPHWKHHQADESALWAAVSGSALLWAGMALFIVYMLAQAWLLAGHGQTFGKRFCGIRIIRDIGKPAGFLSTLILRTVVFFLICVTAIGGTLNLLGLADNFHVYYFLWIPYLICFFMQFQLTNNYQTLQDRFAGTVVVKAKMKQEA